MEKNLFKIYCDGGHYIGYMPTTDPRKGQRYNRSTPWDTVYDHFSADARKQGLRDSKAKAYIKSGLIDNFDDGDHWDAYIAHRWERDLANRYGRRRRFKRKAHMNDWNYFVTITYDDKKHNADSFRASLKKCFSNFHTRRGWYYMGVFETSPTERLHFHALLYVPDGQMVGDIFETKDYSFKYRTTQTAMQNSFFLDRFGRNDFEHITEFDLKYGAAIDYIIKYLDKSGESVFYSRGIPEYLLTHLSKDDIFCEIFDFIPKYLFFDDILTDNTSLLADYLEDHGGAVIIDDAPRRRPPA